MTVVETGTSSPGDKFRVTIPEDEEVPLEHDIPYEIEWSGVVRVPEIGVGGGPAFDPVAKMSGEIYKHILAQGGRYPHYFYCEFIEGKKVLDGGYYEYIIHTMRVQFIAGSPFAISAAIIIALAVAAGIIIFSVGFTFYVIKPAGEAFGGAGGIIIVLSVITVLAIIGVTVGPSIAESVMKPRG